MIETWIGLLQSGNYQLNNLSAHLHIKTYATDLQYHSALGVYCDWAASKGLITRRWCQGPLFYFAVYGALNTFSFPARLNEARLTNEELESVYLESFELSVRRLQNIAKRRSRRLRTSISSTN